MDSTTDRRHWDSGPGRERAGTVDCSAQFVQITGRSRRLEDPLERDVPGAAARAPAASATSRTASSSPSNRHNTTRSSRITIDADLAHRQSGGRKPLRVSANPLIEHAQIALAHVWPHASRDELAYRSGGHLAARLALETRARKRETLRSTRLGDRRLTLPDRVRDCSHEDRAVCPRRIWPVSTAALDLASAEAAAGGLVPWRRRCRSRRNPATASSRYSGLERTMTGVASRSRGAGVGWRGKRSPTGCRCVTRSGAGLAVSADLDAAQNACSRCRLWMSSRVKRLSAAGPKSVSG